MNLVTLTGSGVLTQAIVSATVNVNSATVVSIENYTSIGENAFSNYEQLQLVIISNSVTSIGESAFYNCTSLLAIVIPASVKTIGINAFLGCTGLTSVTIGQSVTSIGENAFLGCTSLLAIVIPASVTTIGINAFQGCTGLTSVTIGQSVTIINENAFYNCTSLPAIVIPASVTTIGINAFAYSGVNYVTIENGQVITEINNVANTDTSPPSTTVQDIATITFVSPDNNVDFFGTTVSTIPPTSSSSLTLTSQQPKQPKQPQRPQSTGVVTISQTKNPIIFEIISVLNKTNILKEFEMYSKLLENLSLLFNNRQR